jgi:hypothetical protein
MIGAPNTSSYFMRNVGGKRESLSFYCPDRPLYIENVALRAMFSLSMLEHVQSTHEHSMYSMISMSLQQCKLLFALLLLILARKRATPSIILLYRYVIVLTLACAPAHNI